MLAKVIDYEKRVAAPLREILCHRASGIGGKPLNTRRLISASIYKNASLTRTVSFDCIDDLSHRGRLLSYRAIDANHSAVALVDDGVDRNRSLAGLTIANYQLSLPPPQWQHRIDHK